jgi:peptidyl-tRNA hydrolase
VDSVSSNFGASTPDRPCHAILGGITGNQDLTGQRQHVGRQARLQQHGWLEFLRLGMGLGLVQDVAQVTEHVLEQGQADRRH